MQFTGSNELIYRLAEQVGSKEMAIGILKKRGHITPDGKSFTKKGAERNAMTSQERALDRGSKRFGVDKGQLQYNSVTNKAYKI
jgi:hypothetical protein